MERFNSMLYDNDINVNQYDSTFVDELCEEMFDEHDMFIDPMCFSYRYVSDENWYEIDEDVEQKIVECANNM